ncbi:MAG: translocation/assembly module TamB domain-containing protein, partial [Candidatus Zixiibacteriota bacterium]
YEGDVHINAQVNFDDLKDFENQIFIKQMAGKGKANLMISGESSDFDVRGNFLSDSCYFYQLYSSDLKTEFEVTNLLSRRKGTFDLFFLNGFAWSIPYDSLTSKIQIDRDWVTIDSTSLENDYMNVAFWGTLDLSKIPQPLTLDKIVLNFGENHIESFSPVKMSIDSLGVRINEAVFSCKGGRIDVSGIIDYEERMDLDLKITEFDIVPWVGLITEEKLKGTLSFQAKVDGDFTRPQFDLDGKIIDLKFEEMNLGELKASLSYKDRRLEFKQFDITSPEGAYTLGGFVPVDLSFSSVEKRFSEKPQDLSLKAKGKRLDLIRLFVPEIEYLRGSFEGDLKISGEFLQPQFDGKLNLKDGSLKFVQLSDPVNELAIEMRMKNGSLILDEISGVMEHKERGKDNLFSWFGNIFSPKQKVRGEVSGFGNISFDDIDQPEYELYFAGKDVPINYEYADFSAVADLSVAIVGKAPVLLSGEVVFSQLYYREPFSSSVTVTSFPPHSGEENLWDWNLDISAINNCWVINDDVNLEFKGDVLVLREDGKLRLLGDLETIRGKYFLYGTKFRIEKGSFVFDNIQKIDPKIDFLVSTNLWGRTSTGSKSLGGLGTGSTDQIRLAIKGAISAPEVEPASDSPYSKEEIVELLAFQQGSAAVDTEGVGTLFQERVIKSLGGAYSSRFLENIAGRSLGVETFEIVPAWGDRFSLRDLDAEITVGKYISDKIYLRYTRRLSQSSGQETGVEYRLNKHLLLEGRRDKIGLFHLGLRLNWEY